MKNCPTHLKLNNSMNCFQKKSKKINKCCIKSIVVRHRKTTSIWLSPVKQSKLITQEMETVEISNILDTE